MPSLIDFWDSLCEFVRSLFEPAPERPRAERLRKRLSFEVLEERALLAGGFWISDAFVTEAPGRKWCSPRRVLEW